ncbi:hypothetical protein RHMOL_Rhmol08G0020100 [Rhododendron molle]|uniref:Uncharacterized protein n=1 Tax=Rhododendron molle TaxID=49168 RepID=A0ACC0MK51_RHOML|nr:hypothetical protein RHMOL_Rhmol08G0020100 [Rhododendron molle]
MEESKENPETETPKEMEKQEDSDDQSSPRGVLEIPVSGSDSDNSSTISSSWGTAKSASYRAIFKESHVLHWRNLIEHIKWKKSMRRFSAIPLLLGNEISKRNSRRKLIRNRSADDEIDCGDVVVAPKPSWRNFTHAELSAATDDFSPERLIGKGGHAEVYKGTLPDGQIVAVKRITKKEKKDENNRVGDFLTELGIIAHINHPNAAKLIGFSSDGGLHLVLQFSTHGSLASVLHGANESVLDWKIRFRVAIGISDFGLAKWLPEKWVHHVVHPIEGTFGYMAPEYFMHGVVDEKTDVFAFGVLLLELITGRRAVDSSRQSLVMWAKPLLEMNNVKDIADPRLGDAYDMGEMKRAMWTALSCLHHLPNMRPNMIRVVQLLRGEGGQVELKQKTMGGRTIILDACDLEDYTNTTYLNDLNRHMQLVLE